MGSALRIAFHCLGASCALCVVGWPAAALSGANFQASQEPVDGPYYLAAFINGLDRHLIVRLDRVDGRFYIGADELGELGVVTSGLTFDKDRRIELEAIADLQYSYHADDQRIDFTMPSARLQVERIGSVNPPPPAPITGTGLVLNYAANLQGTRISYTQRLQAQRTLAPAAATGYYGSTPPVSASDAVNAYNALNRTLNVGTELRFFSPIGSIVNSGYTTFESGQVRYLRQDTYWTYASTDSLLTYTAGDQMSSSLSWSRSVRLGGFGIAHNFTVRPDLVTFPVPALGGSAVVPTTVDLYINGLRQFSGLANGGPFLVNAPPSLNGAGQATLVYRDELGRELRVNDLLYVDPRLLSQGLSEWSLEAGYPRFSYGARSFEYGSRPVANGTLRYGLSNRFTLESHVEVAKGLHNLGAGGLLSLGRFGVLNGTLTANRGDTSGEQASLGYQYISPRFSINLQGIRTYGSYRDLGSMLGVSVPGRQMHASFSVAITPRQNVSLTYSRQDASILGGSRILLLGYNASFGSRISLFANAFRDRDQPQSGGIYLGAVVNLDRRISASFSASRYGDTSTLAVSANQSVDYDKGGFGWNVLADGGNGGYRHFLGRLDYQGNYGNVSAQVERSSTDNASFTTRSLYTTGSLVWMDGAVLASRPISDAFAMVSTDGTPDVPVLRENRVVGTTNSGGHLLIPDLLSYDDNHLSIDTLNLPADAQVTTDQLQLAPRSRSGVFARFPISSYQGAVVILTDEQGQPLPVGTPVTLKGETEAQVVGYDGKVFFPQLQLGGNDVSARVGELMCSAQISYQPSDTMRTLGPYVCHAKVSP